MPLGNFFGSLIGSYADKTLQKQKEARDAEDQQKYGEVNSLKMVLADPRATPQMQKAAYDRIIELSGAPKKTKMNLQGIFQRLTGKTGNVPNAPQSLDTDLANSMSKSGTPPTTSSIDPNSPQGIRTDTAKPFYSPEELQAQDMSAYKQKVDIDTDKAMAVEKQKAEDKRDQQEAAQTGKEKLEAIKQKGRESLNSLRSADSFKKLGMQLAAARARQGTSQGGAFARQSLAFQHQDAQKTMEYGQKAVQDTITELQKQQTESASTIKQLQKQNGILGLQDDNIKDAQDTSENIVKAMTTATKLGPLLRTGQIDGEQYLNAVNAVRQGLPEPPVTSSEQQPTAPRQGTRTPAPAKIGTTPVIDLRSP